MMPKVGLLQAFIFELLLRPVVSAGLMKRSMEKHPITCDAGLFMVGSSASVTCHLDKVSGVNAITVIQVPDSYEKGSERNALVCLESKAWGLHCEDTEGFSHDPSLTTLRTDKLTLTIVNVTTDYSGYYGCHTIPPMDDVSPQLCRLTVYRRTDGCKCPGLIVAVSVLPFVVVAAFLYIVWRSSLGQKYIAQCKRGQYQRAAERRNDEDVISSEPQHAGKIANGDAGIHHGTSL